MCARVCVCVRACVCMCDVCLCVCVYRERETERETEREREREKDGWSRVRDVWCEVVLEKHLILPYILICADPQMI